MGKGKYIKSAERACVSKARFDTAEEAESLSEGRFRAYVCPVCHAFHLTSGQGAAKPRPRNGSPTLNAAEPKPPPGPKLADLDWTAALEPDRPKPPRPPKERRRPQGPPAPTSPPVELLDATCASPCGKDGKAKLIFEGRLVKSSRVADPSLRKSLVTGTLVSVVRTEDTLRVVAIRTLQS